MRREMANCKIRTLTSALFVSLLACLVNHIKCECVGTRLAGSCVGQYPPTACNFVTLQSDECTDIIRPQCAEVCESYLDCECTQTQTGHDTDVLGLGGVPVVTVNYIVQCEDIYVGLSCITLDEDECEFVNGCSWNSASSNGSSLISTLITSFTVLMLGLLI